MVESKPCTKCGEVKPFSEFSKKEARCRVCSTEYKRRGRSEKPFHYLATDKRSASKRAGIPCNLTGEYLESIWTGFCPVFKTPLRKPYEGGRKEKISKNTPSLDRLRPDMGYVKGNVMFISDFANTIKSTATAEEVQAVATWLQQTEEEIKRHEDTD
jgi:hypothetical protein